MNERLKKDIGGPHPLDCDPPGRTADVPVNLKSIKDREVLNRPLTEAQIRGIAPPASLAYNTPILEAS